MQCQDDFGQTDRPNYIPADDAYNFFIILCKTTETKIDCLSLMHVMHYNSVFSMFHLPH